MNYDPVAEKILLVGFKRMQNVIYDFFSINCAGTSVPCFAESEDLVNGN